VVAVVIFVFNGLVRHLRKIGVAQSFRLRVFCELERLLLSSYYPFIMKKTMSEFLHHEHLSTHL